MGNKTFIIYVAIWIWEKMIINPGKKAQIETQGGAKVGALLFAKAPTKVLAEYSDYSNVFSVENVVKLPENTEMNEYTIKLEEG